MRNLLFLGALALIVFSSFAHANVSLSKHRIYFDGNNRTDALQLRNTGASSIEFSADLSLVAMSEEGKIYPVDQDKLSAISLVRFSPKRGAIQPGGRQALRFALRKPAGLEDGEYRATLNLVTSLKNNAQGNVNLNSKFAYNIPIIVRHGRVSAQTELLEPQLIVTGGVPHVEVWQTLQGNRSLFGNFVLMDESGQEVGVLNGVATYLPLQRRKVLIPLSTEVSGKITVQYQEIEKYGGNLSANAVVELN